MVGDRIRKIRKEAGLTQTEFAKSIMAKQDQVSSWEIGRARPPDIYLEKITLIYNVRREWLETGEGDAHPPMEMDLKGLIDFQRKLFEEKKEYPGLMEILNDAVNREFVIREDEAEYLAAVDMPGHDRSDYLRELGRYRERRGLPAFEVTADEKKILQYIRLMSEEERQDIIELLEFKASKRRKGGKRDG
jgi:transcriptional regulator with XRE-family HTH domain